MFEYMDDGEEFTVPDWIVALCFSEGGRIVADGVPQAVSIALVEDGTCCVLGDIHF